MGLKTGLFARGTSLQMKISLPVLIGLVVGLGLFSWVGLQAVNITTSRILDERLNRARIAAGLLDQSLSHLLLHMQSAGSAVTDVHSASQFKTMATSLNSVLSDAEMPPVNIVLADAGGRVVQVEHGSPGSPGLDMEEHPDVVALLQAGVPGISNAVVDKTGQQFIIAVSPIAGEGRLLGMAAVVVDIGDLSVHPFNEATRIGDTGYTEVVDGNGVVMIRTQPELPPHILERSDHPQRFAQLINEGKAAVRTCHRCHEEQQNITRKKDVLAFAPLSVASWGVALRQSEEEALAPTTQMERRLLFLGAMVLIGISLLVWAIMQSVVRPIQMLTAATQRVAAGDFKAALPRRRQDEIGRLNAAFRSMTDELQRSRSELLERNRELSVLNSIATTVGQSLDLELILENALERVLEVSRATCGFILLAGADGGSLAVRARVGGAGAFNCGECALPGTCSCYQVMRSGQTLAVNHPSQCPLLKEPLSEEMSGGFVSVPLKSRARTLGVMNVCARDQLTDRDFKLLESIGHYIGLAIENSKLYEEARQKEALRGQLLSRVITAQEEERKRIARELHDEHAQTLTGLIMNMEKMEDLITPAQPQLKARAEKARSLLARLLDNIRLLTVGLRPSDLDDLGLVSAITAYAEERLDNAGIALKFEASGFRGSLPTTIETALFRIVQEAINNVIRHASAKNVLIKLGLENGRVRAVIEDDGRGFEPDLANREGSLGLLGIRERAELLGGTFSIASRRGKGTRLVIEIPVPDTVLAGGTDRGGQA